MRVVVVTTSFPRTAEDPSGHFVLSSARRLQASRHEVHVIAPGGALSEPPREKDGLVVHRAGGGALFAWPGAIARAKEAPWRALAAAEFGVGVLARLRSIGRVDHAVAHWIIPSAFPLSLGIDSPLSVVAHGADVRVLLRGPEIVRARVLRALLDRGAEFTFSAGALLSALKMSVAPDLAEALARAVRVEPPPIDVPEVSAQASALRVSLGLGDGERALVTLGRLIATKRVDLAIAAAHALGGEGRLLVIGDGPERGALERGAAELGARVRFMGALPRREALAWVGAADVLVHPSAVEAAPSAIREARALRVPVVACDAGDVAAWSRDDPGIRVVAASAEGLAAGVREIACIRPRFEYRPLRRTPG